MNPDPSPFAASEALALRFGGIVSTGANTRHQNLLVDYRRCNTLDLTEMR